MTHAASRAWRIALLLGAAAQPWCEAGALEHARGRLAGRGMIAFADWDLDVAGLHLHDVRVEVRGRGFAADHVVVAPDDAGVAIDVLGLAAHTPAARAPLERGAPNPTTPPAAPTAGSASRVDTHGIAVRVRSEGTVSLPLPRGGSVALTDPQLDIDASGVPTLRTRAQLHTPAIERLGELTVDVASLVATRDAGGWHAAASASIDGGPVVALRGHHSEHGATRMTLEDPDGGRMQLDAEDGDAVTMTAMGFALAALGPSVLASAQARGIGLVGGRIDGTLRIDRDERLRVHADGLAISQVVLDDRRLAPRPVVLDALALDGDVTIAARDHIEAQLVLGHREAQLAIAAALHGDRLQLELELAELGCTELLAALPRGMADVLAGARLSGTIDARASLAISFEALARARALEEQPDGGEPEPPPGQLELDFDFLERCRTTLPPASVDLEGLRGPWRHRFLGDDGRTHERVLAAGADGYAPLGRVSYIASAFIALEDMRYWYHDGFDREQIERAFWHNLKNGRVRRGASTISQQAARNIWLGVDRSLARKLQEAYLTALLEDGVSKTRILELYVNLVELGPGIYGVEAAARHHFGVSADQLDVLQSIHLAALAPAPRTLSERFAGGEVDDVWLTALREHARRMHRNRMITDGELHTALHADLRLRKH